MKVISRKQLPTHLPLNSTLIMWLFLEKTDAPDLVWGAVGLLYFLFWVAAIIAIRQEEQVDIPWLK